MKRIGVSLLPAVIAMITLGCGDIAQPLNADGPMFGRGNGNGNGNGGGDDDGGGSAVPGVFVPDSVNGSPQRLLGDGRDFSGVKAPSLGGAEYKEGVCNVVVAIESHIGTDPGDVDTTLVRYHAPFKAPKRPRGECQLGSIAREITFDGTTVIQIQANWPTADADEVGESVNGKGKLSISGCTYRMNPPAYPDTDEMVVERVEGGWIISSLPGGSMAECEQTGDFAQLEFEFHAIDNMVGS